MSEQFASADIIFLALVAGFVILRLRSTLGKRYDDGTPPKRLNILEDNERIIQLPERGAKPTQMQIEEEQQEIAKLAAPEVATGLMAIKAQDIEFSPREFLEGAKMAYEMAFAAFAKGDKNQLKMLLGDEAYKEFATAIDGRSATDEVTESTLVSIKQEDITEAVLKGNIAQITVKFTTDQVHVTRDKTGRITAGDPSLQQRVEEEWTFERDTRSRNPNWKIIAT